MHMQSLCIKKYVFCVNKNKFFEEGIAVLLICTRMFATPLTIKMRPPSPPFDLFNSVEESSEENAIVCV